MPLAAGLRLRGSQARGECCLMSRAVGCRCQQKHSDAASSREEVVSLDCSRTKNLPEMPSLGACPIIHHIQMQYHFSRMDGQSSQHRCKQLFHVVIKS